MSTRARIVILEPKTCRKNFLYRGADGYLEGLGADLVKACEEISGAPDMDSFAFKLLKGEWGLEMDIFGEDGCLDWVYTIEWGNPIGAIFAQQVRFSSGKNVLGEPVDVRAYVADLRESERRRDLRLKELAARCGPCPVCGADRPDLYADVGWDYFEMRCLRFGCAKNVMIKTRSEDELLRRWKSLPKSDGGGFQGLTSEGRQV